MKSVALFRSLQFPPRLGIIALGALFAAALPAIAVTHLKREMEAPPIVLRDLAGGDVNTTTRPVRGNVVVVVFGELYHEKTIQACQMIDQLVQDKRFAGERIIPLLVVAQNAGAEELKAGAVDAKIKSIVVHDPKRAVFGAYQVVVMPSVVVIDKDGRVVHAAAGLLPNLNDAIADSLLYATGKLSAAAFERSLNVQPATMPSEEHLRAERNLQLARQLARRNMDDLAGEKYAEVLKLEPTNSAAHLEFGVLLLKQDKLPHAEVEFKAVLAEQVHSIEARLGMASVQVRRGGGEVDVAEKTVGEILVQYPSHARANYLMGTIQEQKGKIADAAGCYKKAAQSLMARPEQE